MSDRIAVQLKEVSKKYILHHEKPTLVENILTRKWNEEFWALKNINLEIKKGESVGVIGSNGSGKTTLLEIIAGVTTQTEGEVKTFGKSVSLIDLGAGFHPELTGEENIYLNCLLIGMSKLEIKSRIKKIISFADIGQFIDAPFYTYSEGMKLRLGFSVIAHSNPDIVLLDENMAIGDQEFGLRTQKKIQEFIKKGKTLVIVSHLLDLVEKNCGRVIWLNNGSILEQGEGKKL